MRVVGERARGIGYFRLIWVGLARQGRAGQGGVLRCSLLLPPCAPAISVHSAPILLGSRPVPSHPDPLAARPASPLPASSASSPRPPAQPSVRAHAPHPQSPGPIPHTRRHERTLPFLPRPLPDPAQTHALLAWPALSSPWTRPSQSRQALKVMPSLASFSSLFPSPHLRSH